MSISHGVVILASEPDAMLKLHTFYKFIFAESSRRNWYSNVPINSKRLWLNNWWGPWFSKIPLYDGSQKPYYYKTGKTLSGVEIRGSPTKIDSWIAYHKDDDCCDEEIKDFNGK